MTYSKPSEMYQSEADMQAGMYYKHNLGMS